MNLPEWVISRVRVAQTVRQDCRSSTPALKRPREIIYCVIYCEIHVGSPFFLHEQISPMLVFFRLLNIIPINYEQI